MRYILISSILFLASQIHAQVPGFMGKRWAITFEANPTPAVLVMNSNNKLAVNLGGDDSRTSSINRFAYNFRPTLSTEYLVSRNFSLGLSYSRIAVGTITGELVDTPTVREFNDDQDVAKGNSLGLHFKSYGSNSNAPIGFYYTFSAYVTKSNTYDTKKSQVKKLDDDVIQPVVAVGLGTQKMIFKNVFFKIGVEYGFSLISSDILYGYSSATTEEEYAKINLQKSLFGYYLFNFNAAIGVIPF